MRTHREIRYRDRTREVRPLARRRSPPSTDDSVSHARVRTPCLPPSGRNGGLNKHRTRTQWSNTLAHRVKCSRWGFCHHIGNDDDDVIAICWREKKRVRLEH